jgi:hypothetical protein
MFFVIRCIFWLGLVFCHIAGLNTVNPAEIAGKAGVLAGNLASGLAQDGAAAAQAQINAAQAQCLAKPQECLANIDKLSRLAQAAGVSAAAHPNAAGAAAPAQAAAKAAAIPVPPSRDTLLASDRAVARPGRKAGDL